MSQARGQCRDEVTLGGGQCRAAADRHRLVRPEPAALPARLAGLGAAVQGHGGAGVAAGMAWCGGRDVGCWLDDRRRGRSGAEQGQLLLHQRQLLFDDTVGIAACRRVRCLRRRRPGCRLRRSPRRRCAGYGRWLHRCGLCCRGLGGYSLRRRRLSGRRHLRVQMHGQRIERFQAFEQVSKADVYAKGARNFGRCLGQEHRVHAEPGKGTPGEFLVNIDAGKVMEQRAQARTQFGYAIGYGHDGLVGGDGQAVGSRRRRSVLRSALRRIDPVALAFKRIGRQMQALAR